MIKPGEVYIGDKNFKSIADAIQAANEYDIITVYSNIQSADSFSADGRCIRVPFNIKKIIRFFVKLKNRIKSV